MPTLTPHTPTEVTKSWGYELWFINDRINNYCGKLLHIDDTKKFSMHFHINKAETFYVLSGTPILRTVDYSTGTVSETTLAPGDAVEIPRLQAHQLEAANGAVEVIESSTYHEDSDSYRLWT